MSSALRALACALAIVTAMLAARPARAAATVKLLVQDPANLQYLPFWVAKGAGYFRDEGIELDVVSPAAPQQAKAKMHEGVADVAVLSPPTYLELVAEDAPVVLVCNLMKNDAIDLVVRRAVMDERKLSASQPLRARLEGLRGAKIGVAPHPPKRLRALFAAEGLDADKDVQLVILHGKEQIEALRSGKVDALYTHTPFLEAAIVDEGAEILVNQSAGEAPSLANRQIHALVATRAYVAARPDVLDAMARAILRAEQTVRSDRAAAVAAIAREFPSRDRRHLDTIVSVYAPAVPDTPEVSAEGFAPALALFPAGREPPDLGKVDLRAHVAPEFSARAVAAARASSAPKSSSRVWLVAAAGAVATLGIVALAIRRRRATK